MFNDRLGPDRSASSSDRCSVRLGPQAVLDLAEQGHWINISNEKIDDKSKADTIQKALVVIQVLWMLVQCAARKKYGLPLTLLEFHTMIHVACAIGLYICWLQKPLNIQDPEVIYPQEFKGEIALYIQRQFYSWMWDKMALFPPREHDDEPPPHSRHPSRRQMTWLEPQQNPIMKPYDILPCGLAYRHPRESKEASDEFAVTDKFLNRWEAILTTFPFENRGDLAVTASRLFIRHDDPADLILNRLREFAVVQDEQYCEMLFPESKGNIDLNIRAFGFDTALIFDEFASVAMPAFILSIGYGGLHLIAWNWPLPSWTEAVLWKISGLFIAFVTPALVITGTSFSELEKLREDSWGPCWEAISKWIVGILLALTILGHVFSRLFIVTEAFVSLRHVPVGVYVSPTWIQMFPHVQYLFHIAYLGFFKVKDWFK